MTTEISRESEPPTAQPLRSAFARLWVSNACSSLADGLYLMLLPLVALGLTHSPSQIAGVRVAQTAAGFLTGLPAGAIVDRFDRRRLMMAAELLRGAAVVALAVCSTFGGLNLPLLYAAAFAVGTAEAVSQTAAQAMVPMAVTKDRLRKANGRIYGMQTLMNDFVGAPLGAALFGLGISIALYAPASLYFAASLALVRLAGDYAVVRQSRTSVAEDVRAGIGVLWRDPVLRRPALFQALAQLANSAFFAVFVIFAVGAVSTLHLSKFHYSLLLTAAATGAVSGSIASDRLVGRLPGGVLLVAMSVGLAVCFGVPALFPRAVAVAGALVVSGFLTAIGGIFLTTLRQSQAPPHMLGRVAAGTRMLSLAARPVGALLGGLVAQYTSARTLFVALAIVMLAAMPLAWGSVAPLEGARPDPG